jgi:hypothetical protein
MLKYAYSFTIETAGEFQALAWASARWDGATKLYDLMHPPEDWDGETFPVVMGFLEHEAWEVQDAIESEDAGFIPCLCDGLNRRILAMLEGIV